MCSDVNEAALDFGDARRLALGLRFGQELRAFGIRLEDDIEQALAAVGRFLGEPADAIAGRDLYLPLLRRDLAGDDAKERRLAGAVAADKPDMGAGRQRDRGMVEQGAAGDAIGEVGEGKHGTSSAIAVPSATSCRKRLRG